MEFDLIVKENSVVLHSCFCVLTFCSSSVVGPMGPLTGPGVSSIGEALPTKPPRSASQDR